MENETYLDDQSLNITQESGRAPPPAAAAIKFKSTEPTTDCAANKYINRNFSDNCIDVSRAIIVSMPTKNNNDDDAFNDAQSSVWTENMWRRTSDDFATSSTEIEVSHATDAPAPHLHRSHNVQADDDRLLTATIHVPFDDDNRNNLLDCSEPNDNAHTSSGIEDVHKSKCVNQNDEDVSGATANVAESMSQDAKNAHVTLAPPQHQHAYRVESPKPPKDTLTIPVMCGGDGTINGFGIQELSDAGSSIGDYDNTPLISEAESEPDTQDELHATKRPMQQFQSRLISVETLPLNQNSDNSRSESHVKCEEEFVSQSPPPLPPPPSAFLLDDSSLPLTAKCSLSSLPPAAKRQKLPPLPSSAYASASSSTTTNHSAHLLNPSINNSYLQAISEENSDASDNEPTPSPQPLPSKTKANSIKPPNKADAIYPRSSFSRVSRHTNLITPTTEAIREEFPPKGTDVEQQQQQKNLTEVIDFDSSSSNASLSDVDSITSGMDADIEDLASDVRIETPVIGGNDFSAFASISKKSLPAFQSSSSSATALPQPVPSSAQINVIPESEKCLNEYASVSSTNTFKPIDDDRSAGDIYEMLKNIAATSSTESLLCDSISHEIYNNNNQNDLMISCDNNNRNVNANNEIVMASAQINETNETPDDMHPCTFNTTIDTTHQTEHPSHKTQNHQPDNGRSQREHGPQFTGADDEPLSLSTNNITAIMSMSNNSNRTNAYDLNTNTTTTTTNSKNILNRQDSASSYCSSHTTNSSASHSQCTAKNLAAQLNDDLIDEESVKSLRQLSIERVSALPYGDIILDELAKASHHLTDPDMPYPPPKLPRIEDLEIDSTLEPRPPPRTHLPANIKFYANYNVKLSPSPPPVPDRWLGLPTPENPNILVCLSPAQRELYYNYNQSHDGNASASSLLELHNKFVDRRGYHEYTDDEVIAINFRDNTMAMLSKQQPLQQHQQQSQSPEQQYRRDKKTKDDDNRLLALIREMNQLNEKYAQTNNDNHNAHNHFVSDKVPPNRTHESPAQANKFNSERFSNYFDELSRLHPIVEDSTKLKATTPTATMMPKFQYVNSRCPSRKRIGKNGQTICEASELGSQKNRSAEIQRRIDDDAIVTENQTNANRNANGQATAALNHKRVNVVDSVHGDGSSGEAFNANQTKRVNKNSQIHIDDSHTEVHQITNSDDEKTNANDGDSLKATPDSASCEISQQSNQSSRFSFVPKIFTNFFRTNKTDANAQQPQHPDPYSSAVISQEESNKTIETSETLETTEQTNTTITANNSTNIETSFESCWSPSVRPPTSLSPLLKNSSERYSSTQSLYDWFREEREVSVPIPLAHLDRPTTSCGVTNNLYVVKGRDRGRISPNPIRAPRITEPPPPPLRIKKHYNSQRSSHPNDFGLSNFSEIEHKQQPYYGWTLSSNSRSFEKCQSMIEQTVLSPKIQDPLRRMSLPKTMADKQLAQILERERQINVEFDKLERDRLRLLNELEEMRVNQSFEDFFKEHKKRTSVLPAVSTLSQEELLKQRMQEEWLNKVAEREERRLQKIIKVTHSSATNASTTSSNTIMRGVGDEFLERVKERCSKLQIAADDDCSQSSTVHDKRVNDSSDRFAAAVGGVASSIIDSIEVKIIDDGREADFTKLPQHLKEFAELTTQPGHLNNDDDDAIASTIKTESKQITHKIERCDNQDGEFKTNKILANCKRLQYPSPSSSCSSSWLFLLLTA